MEFKAKLNLKFYIVAVLLLGFVILVWYGVGSMASNEILMEDDLPMDNRTKTFFVIALGVIALSWTFSLFTVLRQMLIGYAFYMDDDGIHLTVTAQILLSLIFVVPIRKIPYSAIEKVTQEEGILTLYIDKSKIDMIPAFRIFATKKYHFFSVFTAEKQEDIKSAFEKYSKAN